MNISKSMESIFVAALVIIGASAAATAAVPKLMAPKAKAAVVQNAEIQTVIISAKRLTAEEKAKLAD